MAAGARRNGCPRACRAAACACFHRRGHLILQTLPPSLPFACPACCLPLTVIHADADADADAEADGEEVAAGSRLTRARCGMASRMNGQPVGLQYRQPKLTPPTTRVSECDHRLMIRLRPSGILSSDATIPRRPAPVCYWIPRCCPRVLAACHPPRARSIRSAGSTPPTP